MRPAASLRAQPGAMLAFFAGRHRGIGLRRRGCRRALAAREPPARALKAGGGDYRLPPARLAARRLALLGAGAALAWLPPVRGLPVFGYVAVAALLFGAVLLVPALTVRDCSPRCRASGRVVFDTAIAQLEDNVGLSTLSLASHHRQLQPDGRDGDHGVFLPRSRSSAGSASCCRRTCSCAYRSGSDTAFLSPATRRGIAARAGRRAHRLPPHATSCCSTPSRPPVTLIARDIDGAAPADELPLVQPAPLPRVRSPARRAGLDFRGAAGSVRLLGLGGAARAAAGWTPGALRHRRHLARLCPRDRRRGDRAARPTSPPPAIAARPKARLARRARASTPPARSPRSAARSAARRRARDTHQHRELRERSLQIFDRAFAITYALEAIAVLIGLAGVSFAASSTALARRARIRHAAPHRHAAPPGARHAAGEGMLMSLFGVLYGLALGARAQPGAGVRRSTASPSTGASIWPFPGWQLGLLSAPLVAAAALTAIWSGRAAMSQDAHARRAGGLVRPRGCVAGARVGGGRRAARPPARPVGTRSRAGAPPRAAPARRRYAHGSAGPRARFPGDFGSHPEFRTEWWYVTGWLTTRERANRSAFRSPFFAPGPTPTENNPSAFAAAPVAHRALRHQRPRARGGSGRISASAAPDSASPRPRDGDTNVWIDRLASCARGAARLRRATCAGGRVRAAIEPEPRRSRRCSTAIRASAAKVPPRRPRAITTACRICRSPASVRRGGGARIRCPARPGSITNGRANISTPGRRLGLDRHQPR